MKSSIFWNITKCSPLKINQHFGGTCCLNRANSMRATYFRAGYSSTLKMEAICSSETLVEFQWTIRRYIQGYRTIHNHNCEDLRSYTALYPRR
jgi:hypothetical protein